MRSQAQLGNEKGKVDAGFRSVSNVGWALPTISFILWPNQGNEFGVRFTSTRSQPKLEKQKKTFGDEDARH